MPQRMILFFVSIAFSFIAWGMVHRVCSLGVPGVVSPDLPPAFAHAAAYGDVIATVLALLSLLLLPSAAGVVAAWIFSLWSSTDLLNAFYQANHRRLHKESSGGQTESESCRNQ